VTNGPHSVLERNEYEPYGQVLAGGYADRPGFTGHVKDAQTGMNYMQQRYYDPMIGRFLSVDPVTAYDKPLTNFNRYFYANNNPYRFTDPDGRFPGDCGGTLCDRYREQGGRMCEMTCLGGKGSTTAGLFRRHKTPESQKKLIESVGGDTETLKLAQETHEGFVGAVIGLATGGGLGGGAKQGPVIIGETMARVEAFAAKIPGAKILNDMPDFKAMGMNADQVTSAMMQYNRRWILEQMRSGRQIIDIGADAWRARPSIFYQMEQSMLRNYQKLHDEFAGAVSP
jgi:RHS repeat-associated protein